MKLVEIDHSWSKEETGHWVFLIENTNDLMFYFDTIQSKFSSDAIDFWMDAKKNQERKYPSTLGHFTGENSTKQIACIELSFIPEGKEMSLPDYCSRMDSILVDKLQNMQKMLRNDNFVKVNAVGGYSLYNKKEMKIYNTIECNERQAIDYLMGLPFN